MTFIISVRLNSHNHIYYTALERIENNLCVLFLKTIFGGNTRDISGKYPKYGGDVVKGIFGAYCKNKCDMNVS